MQIYLHIGSADMSKSHIGRTLGKTQPNPGSQADAPLCIIMPLVRGIAMLPLVKTKPVT